MKTVTTEGKELRYWDFSSPVTDSEGKPVTKQVVVNGETVVSSVAGAWVRKPTSTSYNALESSDEVIEALQKDEANLIALINAGAEAIASLKAGVPPEGTFSKAMVSAASKALKAAPQFKSLKGSALREAVMRYISDNAGIKAGFLAAFDSLRTAPSEDEDEE